MMYREIKNVFLFFFLYFIKTTYPYLAFANKSDVGSTPEINKFRLKSVKNSLKMSDLIPLLQNFPVIIE